MYGRFGRGRGFGLGRGFGRGMGPGSGRGFGFRGASPAWPYVGRGRGGLPRCGYFFGATYPGPVYRGPFYGPVTGTPGYAPCAAGTREEEISYLTDQAEAIKADLDGIESRIRDLEGQQ